MYSIPHTFNQVFGLCTFIYGSDDSIRNNYFESTFIAMPWDFPISPHLHKYQCLYQMELNFNLILLLTKLFICIPEQIEQANA
jgi:hypothetical protein